MMTSPKHTAEVTASTITDAQLAQIADDDRVPIMTRAAAALALSFGFRTDACDSAFYLKNRAKHWCAEEWNKRYAEKL